MKAKFGAKFKKNKALERKVARETDATAKRIAFDVKNFVERNVKRKTPKRGKPRELSLFDASGGVVMSMTEFKKILRGEKKDERGVFNRDAKQTGALSGRRLDRLRESETKRSLKEEAEIEAIDAARKAGFSRKNVSKKRRAAAKSRDWVDVALSHEKPTVKKQGAPPGELPFSWRRVDLTGTGKKVAGFPNYYLNKRWVVERVRRGEYVLKLSAFFTSGKTGRIFEVLERGGTIENETNLFVGYTVERYRVHYKTSYGLRPEQGERQRIKPYYRKRFSTSRVAARPYMKPANESIDASRVEQVKKLLKGLG